MKKHIIRAAKHPLISGSAVIVIGSLIANVFNYIFNFSLLRLLPKEYGIIAGLIAIFNVFAVFSTTIVTIFSKFTSVYFAQKNEQYIAALLRKGTVSIAFGSIVFTAVLCLFSVPVSNFFHIGNPWFVVLIAFSLCVTFLASVANGVLQGLLRFFSFSIIYILQTIIKILLAVGFILLGLHVLGGVLGIVVSLTIGMVLSFSFLVKYLKNPHVKQLKMPNFHRELSRFALPVFLSGIGFTLLITVDILLADHYFTKILASQYAALSLMGRSIFFVVQPVSTVLFPLIAQKKAKNEEVFATLLLCLFLIAIPTIILSGVYFLTPTIILKIFAPGILFLPLSHYLGFFSIFIACYTFSYFLNTYYLSVGETNVCWFSIIASIFETLYIVFFHQSLWQIVIGITGISFLLLMSLLVYYFHKNS